MKAFAILLGVFSLAQAASRTSPPAGCITVAKSGGQFSTVQAAVNSLSTSATGQQCVFINPGTYREQVLVAARKAQLTIYGYTEDDTSYKSNTVTIINKRAANEGISNDETGTLRVKAVGFRLYNVKVVNDYGEGSQAIALSAQVDSGYYGSSFVGFQDTVLSNAGNQVYVKNEIVGATDFIFGRRARSWFEKTDIRVVAKSLGYVTANGREDGKAEGSYYVLNNSNIAGVAGSDVPNGAYYLGRPWGAYARVVFQHTTMTAVINQAGWREWNAGDPRTSNVLFGEYGNSGAGYNENTRASFSKRLSAPVTIQEILGSGYATQLYFDNAYFSS